MSERPQHVMDREGLIWRVVRDGGMATRADFTSIGIEGLRRTRGPLVDVEAALAASPSVEALDFDALDLAIRNAYDAYGTAGVIREYARLSEDRP